MAVRVALTTPGGAADALAASVRVIGEHFVRGP
jgi:hypothetical protein